MAEHDILTASFTHGASMLPSGVLTKSQKTYLFGHPIAHSMAPLLHNTLFATHGVPWSYILHESLDVDSFLRLLKADDCIGSAVTMPHKVTFMPHVDALTEEALMIGSINTVFIRLSPTGQKRYIGTNTDCIGVREAFLLNVPASTIAAARGRPALVIGGGGACRSAVYALWRWLGADTIYITNRERGEVDAVISAFEAAGFGGKIVWVGSVEQAKGLETPGLVAGTVPDFEPREQGEWVVRGVVRELLEREGGKGAVLEMCYHPRPVTALYRIAEAAGWKVVDGTEAMVHQGIAQQVLWREAELESLGVEETQRVVREELERRWSE